MFEYGAKERKPLLILNFQNCLIISNEFIHKYNPNSQKVGKKQVAITCKSHKPKFYSKLIIENMSNM